MVRAASSPSGARTPAWCSVTLYWRNSIRVPVQLSLKARSTTASCLDCVLVDSELFPLSFSSVQAVMLGVPSLILTTWPQMYASIGQHTPPCWLPCCKGKPLPPDSQALLPSSSANRTAQLFFKVIFARLMPISTVPSAQQLIQQAFIAPSLAATATTVGEPFSRLYASNLAQRFVEYTEDHPLRFPPPLGRLQAPAQHHPLAFHAAPGQSQAHAIANFPVLYSANFCSA